jgi:hypothetical protein
LFTIFHGVVIEPVRNEKTTTLRVTNDNWVTPRHIYNALNYEFNFDFDPCPLFAEFNGLDPLLSWGARNYVNPPYSLQLKNQFIMRAFNERKRGNLSVLLLPVSTSTEVFHRYIYNKAEIRFLKGRVKFTGYNEAGVLVHSKPAMHDTMIVIYRP